MHSRRVRAWWASLTPEQRAAQKAKMQAGKARVDWNEVGSRARRNYWAKIPSGRRSAILSGRMRKWWAKLTPAERKLVVHQRILARLSPEELRKARTAGVSKGVKRYWARFSPEERSAINRQRFRKGLANADQRWLRAAYSRAGKTQWQRKSPEERQAQLTMLRAKALAANLARSVKPTHGAEIVRRRLAGEPAVALAQEFGVCPSTIRKIIRDAKRGLT
jgi:hypothetical protein